MRDYYSEFVTSRYEKTQKPPFTEGTKGAEAPSVPFAPSVYSEYSESSAATDADAVQSANVPRNEIFEERVAIMIYDGGLSEAEAIQYLVNNSCSTDFECE